MEMRSTPVSARARTLSKRDAAGNFQDGARVVDANCLAQRGQVHVVEQDHLRAGSQCLSQLGQRFDLDLDKRRLRRHLRRGREHLRHAAGRGDVVFLDQHGVVQADAVIGAAAHAHGVFLCQAQPGQRLAGVDDLRACAAHRFDIGRRLGRHAQLSSCRKLRAVRSAVSRPRAEPSTSSTTWSARARPALQAPASESECPGPAAATPPPPRARRRSRPLHAPARGPGRGAPDRPGLPSGRRSLRPPPGRVPRLRARVQPPHRVRNRSLPCRQA